MTSRAAERHEAEPDTFPASSSRGRIVQELDDARRLLLHDPGRDPVAVADQLAVEQEDREGREALGTVVAVVDSSIVRCSGGGESAARRCSSSLTPASRSASALTVVAA